LTKKRGRVWGYVPLLTGGVVWGWDVPPPQRKLFEFSGKNADFLHVHWENYL